MPDKPNAVHQAFAEYIFEQTGHKVSAKSVQIWEAQRRPFFASDEHARAKKAKEIADLEDKLTLLRTDLAKPAAKAKPAPAPAMAIAASATATSSPASPEEPKRGRGRPRKDVAPVETVDAEVVSDDDSDTWQDDDTAAEPSAVKLASVPDADDDWQDGDTGAVEQVEEY